MLIWIKELKWKNFEFLIKNIFVNYKEICEILINRSISCSDEDFNKLKESILFLNSSLLEWKIPEKEHDIIANKIKEIADNFDKDMKIFRKLSEIKLKEAKEREEENPEKLLEFI